VADLHFDSPLQYVKGVGPRKAKILEDHGLSTVGDLLRYYPRQYLDRTNVVPIAKAVLDLPVTIIGRVKAHGILHGKRRRYEVLLQDESGAISLLWFAGIKYWERLFKKDMVFAATGTPGYFMGRQMVHPDLERLDDDSDKMIHAGRIIPVYPQTSELTKVGLSSKGIRRITSFVFENLSGGIPELVPSPELQKLKLMPMDQAVRGVHYPDSREQIEQCRRRLAFDELLGYQYLIVRRRHQKAAITKTHQYNPPGNRLQRFKQLLTFELTPGQKKATREIFEDLQGQSPMSRLLQGDVGCGKTVVAISAAAYVAENKRQVAFMVPTEILAEQHYRNWQPFLDELGISSALLTSSLTAAKKKKVAAACAAGEIDILFGTHALVYDYVTFPQLGLVIIDEQHRFGVRHRSKLYAKGDNPDLLAMTATPIPRTLAMTLYGDLDISSITDLPPGRKPVRTVWRGADTMPKVLKFVVDQVADGGQAYIIYPLIEKSERIELENVEDAYEKLSKGLLADLRLGMVHGRVKSDQRSELLEKFRDGQLDVLLATTVVEVGLDNPNATVMIIEHAERFGLAQLHQLRGRIGRGEKPSTLIAIAHQPLSEIAHQRLSHFTETTDGFEIAEADLQLRGPGEVFGLRQSGLPELRLARLVADQDLLQASRNLLERIFSSEPNVDRAYVPLYKSLEQNAARFSVPTGGG
jgi:ATP-dependent DNA helicase RecG